MPFLCPGKLLLPPWTPLPHAATRLRAGASQMGPGETQALPPRSLHPEASPSFSGDRSLSTTPVLPLPLRQLIQTGIVWGNTKQGQQATSLLLSGPGDRANYLPVVSSCGRSWAQGRGTPPTTRSHFSSSKVLPPAARYKLALTPHIPGPHKSSWVAGPSPTPPR